MTTMKFSSSPAVHNWRRYALRLAEEAVAMERAGRSAHADRLADEVRQICAQSALRNVGEFAGWGLRGLANGVAAVGGAIGHGLYDLGSGIAGGWTGQYSPAVPATSVKQPNGLSTAHLPSVQSAAWARAQGITLEQFVERCRTWVSGNRGDDLAAHLTESGVPAYVIKYVNQRLG